jgi:O-methyltransferase
MSGVYPPHPLFAGHPYFPERLGYLRLLGLTKPSAARLIRAAKPYTFMSSRNLTTLFREGRRVLKAGVGGDFVEIGVHRGGSAGILAGLIKTELDRQLHLFDRWGDLPEPTDQDGVRYEEYRKDQIPDKLAELRDNPPLESTKQLIEDVVGFPVERVQYYAGWYDDTLADYSGGPIAFASLDCDYYESMKLALAFIDRHASPAATVVADDYGHLPGIYEGWPGARRAVDEWLASTRRKVRIHPLQTGPAVLRFYD